MTDKEKYADKLMDAFGGIDDKYIYEAGSYTPKKRMPRYVAAIIAAAASFIFVIGASFPLILTLLRSGVHSGENASNQKTALMRMEESFAEANAESYAALPEISGAALIWSTDDKGYSYIPISEEKAETVISCIGQESTSDVSYSDCRIWIKTKNGDYISPELKNSPGNTGCALFEYMPEINVSDRAAVLITNILKERN